MLGFSFDSEGIIEEIVELNILIGSYNFREIEEEARLLWRKIALLQKLQDKNSKGDPYFLLDGPPYANNVPHVGHVRNTVFKDLYIRLAFMKGKNVLFQPGFDTHGLPIENMVEKQLDLKSKKDIEALGVNKFVAICKEKAIENKDLWIKVYDKLGSWYSWKKPYITFDNTYIESTWWGFKQLFEKGMVYEGKKPVFWCPHCQTALAGYEATDSYKNVVDPLIFIKFKIVESKNKELVGSSLLVFTTTPWTLPSNVAVVARGDAEYVNVQTAKGNLILAKNRLIVLEDLDMEYKILGTFKGEVLDGARYEPILDVPSQQELTKNPSALRVYLSIPILKERVASKVKAKKGISTGDVFEHFVSVDDGTGLVHCAPGHGKTDNELGKKYNLPEVSPLDDECRFTDEVGKYAGRFVKEADSDLIDDLKVTGKLLHSGQIEHSYPLCWRCKSPLIYRMSNQWFLKVDPIKEQMLDANERVNWQPDFAQERFRSWVANAEDWNFSRQRYWGIPIPVWKSESGELRVIGSIKELEEMMGKKLPDDFDLHLAAEIVLKGRDGKDMFMARDIFDVWFDSGSAPFAAVHYPFENKKLFENHYPVSRINEAQDQIRGWFYSLMFVGMGVFGKEPYEVVSMPGWVVDKNGDKMSKSQGNYISAEQAIDDFGADNIRFYYCWDVDPSSLQKFNQDTVKMEVTKVHNILWNLHKLLVAESVAQKSIDKDFSIALNLNDLELCTEDKWILSRLASTMSAAIKDLDDFRLHQAGRGIYDFIINDLSRTYAQMIRERLSEDNVALSVMFRCLLDVSRLLASISPHIAEVIYQNIKKELSAMTDYDFKESMHLELLPEVSAGGADDLGLAGFVDEELEKNFVLAMNVLGAILAARDKAQIGIRWPLREIIVDTMDDAMIDAVRRLEDVMLGSANIKGLIFKKVEMDLDFKLNYKELGKAFGQETAQIVELLSSKKEELLRHLKKGEDSFKFHNHEMKKSYFEILQLQPHGYAMGEFKGGFVFLKTGVQDKKMEAEGFVREVTRRVQMLRKNMNLAKQDRISLVIESSDDELRSYLEEEEDSISLKVGASSLDVVEKSSSSFKDVLEDKVKGKSFRVLAKKE
jgi:isoleucyl-tRNA synthetase